MTKKDFPDDLRYNDDFSWVSLEDNIASVGIIAPSAEKVKEFVFIKLPDKGRKISKGENYVSLEAVKWSGHLSSPVSGEIVAVNVSLFDEPSVINKDAYGSWIMKVKLADKKEVDGLMGPDAAEKFYEGKIR